MRMIGATLLAIPLAVAALTGPAGAGDNPLEGICGMSPHPGDADNTVATNSQFEGVGVFNITGEDQSLQTFAEPGDVARFFVFAINTDDSAHDIVVRADLDGELPAPGFVVKVLRITNKKDVTDKVFGLNGLRLRNVGPDESAAELIFRVKMLPGANSESRIDMFATANYETASFCGDTVGMAAGSVDPN